MRGSRHDRRITLSLEGLEERRLLDGALDTTFDGDGRLAFDFSSFGSSLNFKKTNARVIDVQSDGRILVAGDGFLGMTGVQVARLFQDGSMDSSFGKSGQVSLDLNLLALNLPGVQPLAIKYLSSGKIMVAIGTDFGSRNAFVAVRLNPNGSLDLSYGKSGIATFTFPSASAGATAADVQADGRVVLVGAASDGGNSNFAAMRLTASGALDTSFNGTGTAQIPFDLVFAGRDEANAVAVGSDGKIVIAGSARTSSSTLFAVARLTTAGTLDISFNGSGQQTIDADPKFNPLSGAEGLALTSDDRIVLAGALSSNMGIAQSCGVVRLTTSGSLDSSFYGTGKRSVGFSPTAVSWKDVTSVEVQTDGKIVLAGYGRVPKNVPWPTFNDLDFMVARLNYNGVEDTSFNSTGFQSVAFDLETHANLNNVDSAYTLGLQQDGKILVAGSATTDAGSNFAVARILATSSGTTPPPPPPTGTQTTSTSLSASTTQVPLSQPVTFTARVTPSAATGEVQFYDGGTSLGAATLSAGSAVFTTSSLAAGEHAITAFYAGSSTYAPSASAAQVVTVSSSSQSFATATDLVVSSSSLTAGQSLGLTATVFPPGATGQVRFLDGNTLLGTATVTAGVASFNTSSLAIGRHDLTAVYDGDASYQSSRSPTRAVSVNPVVPLPPPAPRVLSATLARGSRPTVTLVFSQDLKATLARNLQNFTARILGRGGRAVGISGVRYLAGSKSIVLNLSGRLQPTQTLRLTVSAAGIVSTRGVKLDGNGDGRAGDNYAKVLS